jgi:hypothetical protein
LSVGGGTIEVVFVPGEIELRRPTLLEWISAAARAVAAYYGRFPVSHVQVLVIPAPGRGIRSGTTFGYRQVAPEDLMRFLMRLVRTCRPMRFPEGVGPTW